MVKNLIRFEIFEQKKKKRRSKLLKSQNMVGQYCFWKVLQKKLVVSVLNKETKFERGEFHVLMFWSPNFEEARYVRDVAYTGL